MSWIDDALPLPVARPLESEEALEATAHVLAALAAGIAAMQLLIAIVLGDLLPAAFFAAALLATGGCAFVADRSRWRRSAFLAGGCASVLVWLTVLPGAPASAISVVFGMAGISAMITRQLLVDGVESRGGTAEAPEMPLGWIEDDREGVLAA